jgi:predicted metal-dependent peptidase
MSAEDWSIMVEQAAMAARMAGTMPGGLEQFIKAGRKVDTEWTEELKEAVIQNIVTSESYTHPNRRFIGNGVYLPGAIRNNIGWVVLVMDSSGSTWGTLLEVFGSNINNIVEEVKPERVTLLHVDTAVRKVEEFEPGEKVVINAKGGGGTLFQPAFDWINAQDEVPLAVVYLTDMDNSDRGQLKEPDYPVIWCAPKWIADRTTPEFGRMVGVEA